MLKLFAEDVEISNYRYGCFVTSLELPAHLVWKLYRMRADAENRIKELKYDFGADSFNVNGFSATEAAMNCVMLAYNLMSLFRQVVVCGKVQPTLKTMRYKIFANGGYVIKEGNKRILKLCMAMKRRQWFEGLWGKSMSFDLPAHFPSHL
ncbi:MAG: transposase [Nitrospirae bacterium]|nr:transposase [Nitrospirota bacterium]